MSGQRDHLHIPNRHFTPHRPIPTLPANVDNYIDQLLASPPRMPSLHEMDNRDGHLRPLSASAHQHQQQQLTMQSPEDQKRALQALAERQQQQIEESQRQLQKSQDTVDSLTRAFNDLAAQPRPLTVSSAPKKKPRLPPFDSKNVLIWIRRVEAAYSRVRVVEPKDKFAWMESIFQVKIDPQIDSFLYTNNNTAQNWTDMFMVYHGLLCACTCRFNNCRLIASTVMLMLATG